MTEAKPMFETLDRIMNLDIGQRGVDKLYAPARARSDEPLCAAAARHLSRTKAGDCVVLITGSLTRPWVSLNIGETDGPVGVAALARALSYGFNAIPVVVTDTSLIEPISATLRASGQAIATLAEAKRATSNKRFCSVAVMLGFPLEDTQARNEAQRIISEFRPTAVIAVERAGMTPKGTYHNMLGQDYSQGRARIDYLVEHATSSRIPTIGVGDGGNEIGMGAIAEAVHRHVPHGEILCAKLATDVLLPAGVSNWGCYAIQAALAVITGKPDLLHTAAMEKRLVEAAANAGLVDGNTGKCEATVDGLSLEVHMGIVELLGAASHRGLKPSH
jgi:D-glutamate cyclase